MGAYTGYIVAGIIVLVLILMYNSLVSKKNQVENIFGTIDVLLKKRRDLIPNLVESVKAYMKHEKDILEKITELRSRAEKSSDENEKMNYENQISSLLGKILVNVENYPELKANENVMHLQMTLTEIEEQISAARRAYNQAVTDYNNAIEMIPTNFMAKFMGYQRKNVFEISESERENIDVGDLFKQ
ncbi:LemA protein [Nautilia profundicola AmH]|uniref:LemA protein n=1 Tax=Nautilia profundicola (strain ATCC BAA-1463 / DSM 18972 / AmH) TaxID=598659 RepID=B9L5U0_NAUPA|nr:LemA family protein [Nautilia profundicola]ACM93312.1 LemA protein [Nautilia profundicola AmH]